MTALIVITAIMVLHMTMITRGESPAWIHQQADRLSLPHRDQDRGNCHHGGSLHQQCGGHNKCHLSNYLCYLFLHRFPLGPRCPWSWCWRESSPSRSPVWRSMASTWGPGGYITAFKMTLSHLVYSP